MLSVASWFCKKCKTRNEISIKNIIDAIDVENSPPYFSFIPFLLACNCKDCNERHVIIMEVNVNASGQGVSKRQEVSISGEIILTITKDDYKRIEDLMKN